MPKLRGELMTVRIPEDEKIFLQAIANHADVSLSDVVIRGLRDFLESKSDLLKNLEASGEIRKLREELTEKKKNRSR